MLSTIDGPVAAGLASDPNLEGDWNAVIAARSTNPSNIVNTIGKFAIALGQAPELYGEEYVYQYDNKMIRVGAIGNIFYLKMLNYEQTEGNAGENSDLNSLFATNPFAVALRSHGGSLRYGLIDMIDGKGAFTASDSIPAPLALLQTLCGVKAPQAFDDMLDDIDETPTGFGDAIDGFHELN